MPHDVPMRKRMCGLGARDLRGTCMVHRASLHGVLSCVNYSHVTIHVHSAGEAMCGQPPHPCFTSLSREDTCTNCLLQGRSSAVFALGATAEWNRSRGIVLPIRWLSLRLDT